MTPDIRERAERLHDSLSFHYTTTKADRVDILSQALLEAHNAGREEMREEAAKTVETHSDQVLVVWERPGGPPGNQLRAATRQDLATAIRSIK